MTIVQNTTEKRGAIPPPPEGLTRREDLSFTSAESAQPLSGRLLLYNSYLIYLALSFQSVLLDADKTDFFYLSHVLELFNVRYFLVAFLQSQHVFHNYSM